MLCYAMSSSGADLALLHGAAGLDEEADRVYDVNGDHVPGDGAHLLHNLQRSGGGSSTRVL